MIFSKLLVIMLLLLSVSAPLVGASSEPLVSTAVTEAEDGLVRAYETILEAEKVGANVSVFLGELNVAGEYLVEAHFQLNLGDYEGANLYANLCLDKVTDVEAEALLLRDKFESLENDGFLVRLFLSFFGVVVVVVGSFVFWRIFKRRYVARIMSLKPEVFSDES